MNEDQLLAPKDDGLEIASVKRWSADKHYLLRRYIHGFTQAMKDKAWSSLHYIDLFAGPGIERIEDEGLDWGSPLIAAQSKHPFSQLHLVEINKKKYDALVHRLSEFDQPNLPQVIHGDANVAVDEVIRVIPSSALSLAFLDPYKLNLHFSTIRKLAEKRVDLIIFFPDYLDAKRNWKIYLGKPDSNLTVVLGTDAWEKPISESPPENHADILTNVYVDQIKSLGYSQFDYRRITRGGGSYLYRLVFCSMHPAGLSIWNGIAKRERGGQGNLF